MKRTKILPLAAAALCVPGVALRALHLLNGFELGTGLPVKGDPWYLAIIGYFALCAVLFAVLAAPLRRQNGAPFEALLGTQDTGFRMAAVVSGLLLLAGGAAYLYVTLTTVEQDAAGWARILEIVYAAFTLLSGVCAVMLAGAQGRDMTRKAAMLTLAPLFWGCLHLLVTYRMTCVDPKLPSFAFGLIADVLLVLGLYHLARLLYGKPRPALLAFFSASAAVLAVSDLGGYGLAYLMGVRAVAWSEKTLLRGGLAVAACVLLFAELWVMTRREPEVEA